MAPSVVTTYLTITLFLAQYSLLFSPVALFEMQQGSPYDTDTIHDTNAEMFVEGALEFEEAADVVSACMDQFAEVAETLPEATGTLVLRISVTADGTVDNITFQTDTLVPRPWECGPEIISDTHYSSSGTLVGDLDSSLDGESLQLDRVSLDSGARVDEKEVEESGGGSDNAKGDSEFTIGSSSGELTAEGAARQKIKQAAVRCFRVGKYPAKPSASVVTMPLLFE